MYHISPLFTGSGVLIRTRMDRAREVVLDPAGLAATMSAWPLFGGGVMT